MLQRQFAHDGGAGPGRITPFDAARLFEDIIGQAQTGQVDADQDRGIFAEEAGSFRIGVMDMTVLIENEDSFAGTVERGREQVSRFDRLELACTHHSI
ncbi:hypothetical protein S58_71240 [Bradyrhizobium oligotrophicum S58]|uniref:Uncharacterized protein n=1 Tax=Bradyrhizobium oligotrophicum S58 TaxID=1245469 RepID=M4ZH63_9BRAD|nr:hypothetical protein S58_71240 [Bradyrhizobium oligotrophicum S58]